MLSDRERETLANMEQQLLACNPRLVRRFDGAAKAQRIRSRRAYATRPPWFLDVLLGLALLLSACAVLLGSVGIAAVYALSAAVIWVLRDWLRPGERLAG